VGAEAILDMSVGMKHIRAQVLLRRARANAVGFEIVNTDLESRYRLRRILIEAFEASEEAANSEWSGERSR
jgi:hypothetical protein